MIQKGTGQILGVAHLVDSKGPLTSADMAGAEHLHAVTPERQVLPEVAKYRHAWVLSGARRLSRPVSYAHPSGAVTWVTLAPETVHAILGAA